MPLRPITAAELADHFAELRAWRSTRRLEYRDASGVNLPDFRSEYAVIRDCIFDGANLVGSDFGGADLRDVRFRRTNLSGVKFTRSLLDGVDLTGADLAGSRGLGTARIGDVEGILVLYGMGLAQIVLYPSSDGWTVEVGSHWKGPWVEFRNILSGAEPVPKSSERDWVARAYRTPEPIVHEWAMKSVASVCRAYMRANPNPHRVRRRRKGTPAT